MQVALVYSVFQPISVQFTFEMCIASQNREKIY